MGFHNIEIAEVYSKTGSSEIGLSDEQVSQKKEEFGLNELQEKKKKPAWMIFLSQFKDFMILILIAAAVISGFAGDMTDAIIILVIVFLNAVVGFIQEYNAEKAMEALKKLATLQTQVIRNGTTHHLPSAELVPGDLVLLEAGNAVPADIRLTETHILKIDESALTGESVPVDKSSKLIPDEDIPLGDRFNLAFKGTLITNGRGKGIVTATGMQTEIGKIASLLQEGETVTPLQKRLADFGKKLSWLILAVCAIMFGVGILRGEEPIKMLLLSISLAVAAIPEALPALITIALAMGAKRLVKQNALIRKLPAVETLGSITFICSDKTGTLTENRMKVVKTDEKDSGDKIEGEISMLAAALALNNDVGIDEENKFTGDPTEIALVEHFIQQHSAEQWNTFREQFPRVAELPFDSDRKCMSTVHDFQGRKLILSKGAVEYVAAALENQQLARIILEQADKLAADGIRVLAFAYKITDRLPDPFDYSNVEKDLIYAGLTGMVDPPRKQAKQSITDCRTAGIVPVMITGDHPATAAFIAKEIGILRSNDQVLTGSQLKNLSESEYNERVEQVKVYARVSPEQKLQIVKTLQAKHHYVSMTGDGVNDAPSLKRADIGVAMGITGTDVSKEAADMILLDDNFTTIVKAIREGRRIYDNIRKFVKYIMTCNGAEIWTIFLAPFLGLPIPLLPIHLLWINLVTDGLPGLALAGEGAEKDIMQRPPRDTRESLFAHGIGFHIAWVGLLMAGLTLGTQAWAVHESKEHWQTIVFTVLAFTQLAHVMAIRSERQFLFRQGFFSNLPLLGAVVLTIILQLGVIYLPFANKLFKTQPLTLSEILVCFGVAAVLFHAVEFEKLIRRWVIKRRT
ncbi:cation-translocating P-type ATPase [Pollutibacter soli]|uniref:cation-translocating P-type ATPase n=1 Tax=Pollutibacter soli TaxID=3034157 RepID=UPI0030137ADF